MQVWMQVKGVAVYTYKERVVLCSEDSRIIIEIFIILWHLLYHYKGANHVKGILVQAADL